MTIKEYLDKVKSWIHPREIIASYLEKIKKSNLNAFVRLHEDYIEKNIDEFSKRPLAALPIWIKDNILTKWYITSCWSKMLEDYVPCYSATCFEKLENAWWLMIWKTNMDEFAMWSSNETSYFWKVLNPYWTNRVPWGSSWWSAAAVAADLCIAALWTDTWGSIRQPASLCWVVWIKPTYWRVSRYWVQAMASSLDQVWVLAKNVEDASLLLKIISWKDERDSTSVDAKLWNDNILDNLKWFKIAIIKEFFNEWLADNVKQKIFEIIELIKTLGWEIHYIDFPEINYSLAVYYIIMPAEVSTNLARFDGIRYWYSLDTFDYDSIYEYYSKVRSEWFWDEVKRRILLWCYVLSAWYYESYYLQALKVKRLIKNKFDKIFSDYDVIIWPVSPTVAWKIWEKVNDPLKMYLSDIYTIPVNLAWLPAMSLPIGFVEDEWEKMPVGLHIIAWQFMEEKIFSFARVLESKIQ